MVIASLVIAIPFATIRYSQLSQLVRILIRGLAIIVLILTLTDSPLEVAWPAADGFPDSPLFFRCGALIAITCATLGLWRPSLLLPGLIYYDLSRRVFADLTGVDLVATDYLNLLQIAEFALIGSLLTLFMFGRADTVGPAAKTTMANRLRPWLRSLSPSEGDRLRKISMDLIWSVAIGVHLSKYFWSGIIKLKMDWSPWTWIFHNETYLGVLLGLERGSPLLSSQFATQLFYGTLAYFVIVANIMVVTAQLSSPFSILRARYLLILAMFFEVFHIVVFFSIAALFWTWIGVNTIVVICCSRLREEDFTPAMKMTAFVSVFFALFLFDTPRLGWMDTRAVVSQYFTVETADGRSARVPTEYFMSPTSYTVGHAAMFVPPGHFPWTMSGTQSNLKSAREANACAQPKVSREQIVGPDLAAVKSLVRNTHALMTAYPFVKDAGLFYLFPQHMFSDPFYYQDFNNISLKDVVRYKYVVDSVCLSLKDGLLIRDVQNKSEYPIDVQQ
ncbi:hypothetical protein QEV83_01335 [Methylocapsa sp. D3K7]|uniref:hypothetical protein n=1 Tax=Methylocapsa sp. D3K7 TaxID=3041435 RepID=UPI00244E9DBD|nr:hypothetical protein [Methylocapsa sp. D3K7]WGJ14982.1 hypothetical protein QEV83_01335 [Methylocapsa sp. D3K7]